MVIAEHIGYYANIIWKLMLNKKGKENTGYFQDT